jgi:hypothetical protein
MTDDLQQSRRCGNSLQGHSRETLLRRLLIALPYLNAARKSTIGDVSIVDAWFRYLPSTMEGRRCNAGTCILGTVHISHRLMPMRGPASNIGRRSFRRFSGAQSGFAVRSVGDLPEAAPPALMNYHLFESALVQDRCKGTRT